MFIIRQRWNPNTRTFYPDKWDVILHTGFQNKDSVVHTATSYETAHQWIIRNGNKY